MPLTVSHNAGKDIVLQNSYMAEDFNSAQLIEAHRDLIQPYGEGHMGHWYFDGIRMGYSNWKYNDYVATDWNTDLEIVHLHFNLRGRISLENNSLGKVFSLGSHQHNAFYSKGFQGTIRNDELHNEMFMLQFTKEAFARLTQEAGEWVAPFREAVLEGKPATMSPHNMYIGLPLHRAIRDVLQCKLTGGIKKMYLYSKCLEILVLLSESYKRANQTGKIYCKTEYDQERILFARDYLIQHVDVPPSLGELARIAGINEFKLKKGFKEIFENTVFGYLADYRLGEAQSMLAARQKTATEIAFDLGYSSLQHFSTAFKKKFGVGPGGR